MITALTAIAAVLPGCQPPDRKGKIEIELVQYKPEAVEVFEMLEEKFNASHDNIHLTIESPNDAMTILKPVLSGRTRRILLVSEEISTIPISWIQRCSWIFPITGALRI